MDKMLAICCVYTLRLFNRTLLTAFDALMIPPTIPQVSRFGAAMFTPESARLFYRSLNSLRFSTSERSMSVGGRVGGRSFERFLGRPWEKVDCCCLHAGQALPCLLQEVTMAGFPLRWRNKHHDPILNCETLDWLRRRNDCCLLIRMIE